MLSLERKVKLVAGKDLSLFNPPEVWKQLTKQYGAELPSPHFKVNTEVVDVDASASGYD